MSNDQLVYYLRCDAPISKDHHIHRAADLIEQQQREIDDNQNYMKAQQSLISDQKTRLEAAEKLIARLEFVLDSFDPSEPIGCTYKWIGPDPDLVDKALAAAKSFREGEK